MPYSIKNILLSSITLALLGCAGNPAHPDDPYERYNRAVYAFNDTVDRYAIKPTAEVYRDYTPPPLQSWGSSFLANLNDVWIGVNNVLQGKFTNGMSDVGRFAINSSLGLFGLFDVATDFGFEKHNEDFGQTLAKWGAPEGGYFVIPFLSSSTIRDTVALSADWYLGTPWNAADIPARNALLGFSIINARSRLLGTEKTLNEGTLDTYAYVRDFYLQQRRYKIADGKVSKKESTDDWYDEAEEDHSKTAPPINPNIKITPLFK